MANISIIWYNYLQGKHEMVRAFQHIRMSQNVIPPDGNVLYAELNSECYLKDKMLKTTKTEWCCCKGFISKESVR